MFKPSILVAVAALIYFGAERAQAASNKNPFPVIVEWIKRSSHHKGCLDPTEPFQCPGSDTCISLQFLCDGHAYDCPDNYDENVNLCVAAKRPAKDNIRRLLLAEYSSYGVNLIEYLFGQNAALLFEKMTHVKAIDVISVALAEATNVNEFARMMEMTSEEKKRLIATIEQLSSGQVENLPGFVVNAASEGLSTLIDQLIRTQFLETYQ